MLCKQFVTILAGLGMNLPAHMMILGRHVSNVVLGDHMERESLGAWICFGSWPATKSTQGMDLGLECIQGNVFAMLHSYGSEKHRGW